MPVMCTACGVRPSKIHYTEIVNDNMVTMDLCLECAETKGIEIQKAGSYGLGDLVAGLIDTSARTETEHIGKVRCPSCGYEYSNFKKMGRLGCPDCYEAFEAQLIPLLRQIHGSTQHQGKTPQALGQKALVRKELADLKEELARVVEKEEYEKAAKIRDRIKSLETAADKK